jgi:hypothetical protein
VIGHDDGGGAVAAVDDMHKNLPMSLENESGQQVLTLAVPEICTRRAKSKLGPREGNMLKLKGKACDGVLPCAAALCANPARASANEQRVLLLRIGTKNE